MIPLIWELLPSKSTKIERTVAIRGKEKGKKEELLFHGHRVSVWDDEKVLEIDDCDDCTTM
jgi:hypothetical protein